MSILSPKNCTPRRHRLLDQTTKQPLSNFEPRKLLNISKFEGCGLTLVAYKKSVFTMSLVFEAPLELVCLKLS